jgi:hypothetical protein
MNRSTDGPLVEKRLALVKSTVAASLNSILRQVEECDYGPSSEKRMAHSVQMCREAMRLLLTPEPPKELTARQRAKYVDIEDLTGEK